MSTTVIIYWNIFFGSHWDMKGLKTLKRLLEKKLTNKQYVAIENKAVCHDSNIPKDKL